MSHQLDLTLVGRAPELAALTTALDRASRGAGRLLLLTGAMGMGKSRLTQEAIVLAQERGLITLTSSAYPLDDRLPYAPIIGTLGRYLRGRPADEQEELLANLPYLSGLTGGVAMAQSDPVPALESVARLLERIAKRAPVLWFMDDLHWADQASVELFYYLARHLRLLLDHLEARAQGTPLIALALLDSLAQQG